MFLQRFKHLLVVDLEATCWAEGRGRREDMETIEFGAVIVNMADLAVLTERSWFIRPRLHPELSEFCTQLTSITQADVDAGIPFEQLDNELDGWLAVYREQLGWGSWGDYDRRQLESDGARLGRPSPLAAIPHVNIKKGFAERQKIPGKPPALSRAIELCGLQFEGRLHRGVDDARNIARLLPWLMDPKRTLVVQP